MLKKNPPKYKLKELDQKKKMKEEITVGVSFPHLSPASEIAKRTPEPTTEVSLL